MGGSAFRDEQFPKPTQAHRMSTSQYNTFIDFCVPRLELMFPRVVPLRSFRSKDTHGDLDLRCASDDISDSGTVKGREMGGEGFEYRRNKDVDLRKLCERVATALQAIRWLRNGRELSCAVPVKVIFPDSQLEPLGEMEPFYQVDCCLVPPGSLDFSVFIDSYSGANAVLGPAITLVSRSLCLTQTCLALAHRAFDNQPKIHIPLTSDPEEFSKWAGLDYERWGQGFDRAEEMFLWLISPPGFEAESYHLQSFSKEEKKAIGARHLALVKQQTPGEVRSSHVPVLIRSWRILGAQTGVKRRPAQLAATTETPIEMFKQWLRLPGNRWCPPIPSATPAQAGASMTESISGQTKERDTENLIDARHKPHSEPDKQDHSVSTDTLVPRIDVFVRDPTLPRDLDLGALRALKYFDKIGRYEMLLGEATRAVQQIVSRPSGGSADAGSQETGHGESANGLGKPSSMKDHRGVSEAELSEGSL